MSWKKPTSEQWMQVGFVALFMLGIVSTIIVLARLKWNDVAALMHCLGLDLADDLNSLETILALIKQMEATLLGLKQLRGYVGSGAGQEMVELLIEEGEAKLAEIKRKLIQ
jgi:hypothetical protein